MSRSYVEPESRRALWIRKTAVLFLAVGVPSQQAEEEMRVFLFHLDASGCSQPTASTGRPNRRGPITGSLVLLYAHRG